MTQAINFGYDDSSEHVAESVNLQAPEFAEIYSVTKTSPDEVQLTNRTCPLDQPEKLIQGFQKISNIYKGTPVSAAYQAPSKSGTRIMTRLNEIGVVTDDADPSYRRDVILNGRLILEFSDDALITESQLWNFILRLVGTCYSSNGTTNTSRLAEMMRGGINPV